MRLLQLEKRDTALFLLGEGREVEIQFFTGGFHGQLEKVKLLVPARQGWMFRLLTRPLLIPQQQEEQSCLVSALTYPPLPL